MTWPVVFASAGLIVLVVTVFGFVGMVLYKLQQYSACLKAHGAHLAEIDDAITDPKLWRVRVMKTGMRG